MFTGMQLSRFTKVLLTAVVGIIGAAAPVAARAGDHYLLERQRTRVDRPAPPAAMTPPAPQQQLAVNAPRGAVVVNGVPLSEAQVRALENLNHQPAIPGRYWYDGISGAYGMEGGPALGQTYAGLKMGGPLRADASNGNTGVFVNGRQINLQEVVAWSRTIPVRPGRYWVNHDGVGGLEGQGPSFDLAALARQAGTWSISGSGAFGAKTDAGMVVTVPGNSGHPIVWSR
jgi:hypothetical protein